MFGRAVPSVKLVVVKCKEDCTPNYNSKQTKVSANCTEVHTQYGTCFCFSLVLILILIYIILFNISIPNCWINSISHLFSLGKLIYLCIEQLDTSIQIHVCMKSPHSWLAQSQKQKSNAGNLLSPNKQPEKAQSSQISQMRNIKRTSYH